MMEIQCGMTFIQLIIKNNLIDYLTIFGIEYLEYCGALLDAHRLICNSCPEMIIAI